ncbi:aldo/keto reductase [Dichelobacter nodosus]|uniref:aldo/keto reductase n=1 Tax=Dichelobacter nodosus TaxID=870 RepID=UPI000E294AAF|nr:aldo/keto reductase [Dichelobacter nodosus]AXM46048.1 aldo/keto reductase [Dichelobacter nodosus]
MNTFFLPRRALGKTNIMLSAAGLGTVKFGRNQAMKYPNPYELPDDKTISNLLSLAWEMGINWLDTAPAYGSSESRLGQLLPPKDWIISSKVGEQFIQGKSYFNFTKKETQISLEKSLQRLKRDYLDLVFIHSNGDDERILLHSDVLETLQQAKAKGLIRAIGFSGKTLNGAQIALQYCDALMISYSLTDTDLAPAIKQAAQCDVGVVIKKGFGSGHLFAQYSVTDLSDFLFQQPITAVITGTLSAQHLRENCHALTLAANRYPL